MIRAVLLPTMVPAMPAPAIAGLISGVGVYANGIAVFGDSTAEGNAGVSAYYRAWAYLFANDRSPSLDLYNAGVGGETSAQMLTRVLADSAHRNWPTIFMDRPNTAEAISGAGGWIANMKEAAAHLSHSRWMVFPPAQNAPDTAIANITEAQETLLSDPFFAGHTLDATDQAAYLAAVSASDTRSDGIHFNDKGSAIQAFFASAFFVQQSWRSLLSETQALVARISSAPTTRRQSYMNSLIERTKKCGSWAKRDAFYVLAAPDQQTSLLNWVANSYNLTAMNGPTFLADRYWKGSGVDGEGKHLLSTFNPVTATSPKFVRDSAHMGLWSRTDLDKAGAVSWEMGNACSAMRHAGGVAGQATGRPNTIASGGTIATGAFPGHVMWSRSAAAVWEGYAQGLDTGGSTNASEALTSAAFSILATADLSTYGLNEIATAFWGSNLTATEAFEDFLAQNAYLKAIGAA